MGQEPKRVPGNWKDGRPLFPMEGKDGIIKTKSMFFSLCYPKGKKHHLLCSYAVCFSKRWKPKTTVELL